MNIPVFIARRLALLLEILREVFDENAYRRFLLEHNFRPSKESYAAFVAKSRESSFKKPRCC